MATPREIDAELARLGLDLSAWRIDKPGVVLLAGDWFDAEYDAARVLAVLRRIPWDVHARDPRDDTRPHPFWESGVIWGLLLGLEWAEERFLEFVGRSGNGKGE